MKRWTSGCCAIAIVSLLLVTLAVFIMVCPKSLLDHATRAVDASDWKISGRKGDQRLEFCWLSPNDLLYGVAGQPGRVQLMRKRIDRPDEPPVRMLLTLPENAIEWQVSPDGRSICWIEFRLRGPKSPPLPAPWMCGAAPLDGKNPWKISVASLHTVWSSDSASVYTWDRSYSPDMRQTFLATGRSRAAPPLTRTAPKTPKVYSNWLNMLQAIPDGRLLFAENGASFYFFRSSAPIDSLMRKNKIAMAVYDFRHTEAQPNRWTVPVPPNTESGTFLVSPQGDKLFWQTYTDVVSTPERALHSVFKSYQTHPYRSVRLFVSDLHGNGMHVIAEYHTAINHHSNDSPTRGAIWSPYEKKIGFVMNGGFYTIPAD